MSSNSDTKSNQTKRFIKELRQLLDKYDAKLYTNSCELYLKSKGFIGYVEDNIESIEIVDDCGDILYTSQ